MRFLDVHNQYIGAIRLWSTLKQLDAMTTFTEESLGDKQQSLAAVIHAFFSFCLPFGLIRPVCCCLQVRGKVLNQKQQQRFSELEANKQAVLLVGASLSHWDRPCPICILCRLAR
jgi:hypothetical protein